MFLCLFLVVWDPSTWWDHWQRASSDFISLLSSQHITKFYNFQSKSWTPKSYLNCLQLPRNVWQNLETRTYIGWFTWRGPRRFCTHIIMGVTLLTGSNGSNKWSSIFFFCLLVLLWRKSTLEYPTIDYFRMQIGLIWVDGDAAKYYSLKLLYTEQSVSLLFWLDVNTEVVLQPRKHRRTNIQKKSHSSFYFSNKKFRKHHPAKIALHANNMVTSTVCLCGRKLFIWSSFFCRQ